MPRTVNGTGQIHLDKQEDRGYGEYRDRLGARHGASAGRYSVLIGENNVAIVPVAIGGYGVEDIYLVYISRGVFTSLPSRRTG